MRTYAWMYILGLARPAGAAEPCRDRGSALSEHAGRGAVGIVYGYLPLMILPIYVSLERLDRRLLEASADLGARPVVDLSRRDAPAVAARA